MVNSYSRNRFEEVVHEKNELESPNLIRKKELASIVLRQLEEEREDYEFDFDSEGFSFDEELFRVIFEDPEYYKFT